jgi:PAS domain S-box-containing protein
MDSLPSNIFVPDNTDFKAGDGLATAILETAAVLVVVLDCQGRIVLFNRACRQATGYKWEEVQGRVIWDFLIIPQEREAVRNIFADLCAGHFPNAHENYWVAKDGKRFRTAWQNTTLLDENGKPQWLIGTGVDVTQNRIDNALAAGQARLMELIATGAALSTIFQGIVHLIEEQNSAVVASIVILDEDGIHIRHGAAPHLPEDYWKAIDGLAIGPQTGSCGTAIYHKSQVIVEDIATDPLWKDYRELALSHNLRACWSSPILARDGRALGAFAIYYKEPRRPQEADLKLVRAATHLAGIAIEKEHGEKQLRDSQERFLNMASNVPGMVHQTILHPDGRLEWPFISEGCRDFYNCSPQEIQANPNLPINVLHPDDRPGFDQAVEQSLATLTPLLWEGRYFKSPDEVRWLKTVARPRRLPGNSSSWDGVVIDITAQKRAEYELQAAKNQLEVTITERTQELRESNQQLHKELIEHQRTEEALRFSEAQFRSVVHTAIDSVILADTRGVITEWNRGAEAIFGYARDEIIGQPVEIIIPERYREACKRGFARVLSSGESTLAGRIVELEGLRRDGTIFPIELSLNSWHVGGQMYFSCIARDITERKRLLHRLQDEVAQSWRLQDQLQLQFERMPIGCIVWDSKFCVESWNPAAEEIFGYTADEAQGQAGGDLLLAPSSRDAVIKMWRHLHEGSNDTVHGINENLTKSGRVIMCQWANTPLRDAYGKISGVLSMVQDVTERHLYEQTLQQAKEEAERANAAKSEYMSRISHELRTPLNAIIGFSQILETEKLDTTQQESVAHILRAGEHLLTLVNEVLDISRVEANRLELSLEPVAVEQVLEAAIALVKNQARDKQVTIHFDKAHPCFYFALADRQRLSQVMINLLSNGIKYNRSGGQLTISCTSEGESIRIAVKDTGWGMTPEDLRKIFTPFERLNATNTDIEGTGLGLALSKNLVEAMNGRLTAQSVPGEGSTFSVELPISKAPPIASQDAQPEAFTTDSTLPGSYAVLSIEDNISNYRLMEMIFKKRPGVRLLGAMQGSLGLELAHQHRPDLILLDMQLPDMSGAEVLHKLRADSATANIPVVICSADATEVQIQRMLAAGAIDYITKPISVSRLLSVLDNILVESGESSFS